MHVHNTLSESFPFWCVSCDGVAMQLLYTNALQVVRWMACFMSLRCIYFFKWTQRPSQQAAGSKQDLRISCHASSALRPSSCSQAPLAMHPFWHVCTCTHSTTPFPVKRIGGMNFCPWIWHAAPLHFV